VLSGYSIVKNALAFDAYLTKDVPPYAMVGGAPARVIRFCFSDDTIRQLCDLQWWNWSDEKIQKKPGYFDKPIDF